MATITVLFDTGELATFDAGDFLLSHRRHVRRVSCRRLGCAVEHPAVHREVTGHNTLRITARDVTARWETT